jgi:hypothetical protein
MAAERSAVYRHRSSLAGAVYVTLFVASAAIYPRTGLAAGAWSTLGGNAQHSGVSTVAAQPLETIRWSTPVDLAPPGVIILIHYGSPVVTPANTVIIPVKTGASSGFRVDARSGNDGALKWSATTDYLLPPHSWIPSYSPALTPNNRLYFAGAGGTVHFRDNVDGAAPTGGRVAFFGLANYQANTASFNATVFVNTPITADAAGNIYFGFRTSGAAPLGLVSGIARVDTAGNGTWIAASAAAGDASVTRVPHQAAPALSLDGSILYVAVAGDANAYLVGLDPATLAVKQVQPGTMMRTRLKDPRNGGANNAVVSDNSSASPMVGPDGDVYYGVLGNPQNGSRGWLLHFSGDLMQGKTPGGFGWDNTAAVVPASAVPSYTGSSAYLLFSKYNNYAGSDGGDGVNRIAVLDPNDTMVEPHASSNGTLVMKAILAVAGPTPDTDLLPQFPNAVKEWCINAAAVDPVTRSVMVNNEDGKLYRWDLATNTLVQPVVLSSGIPEAYTSTLIGADGMVYATNFAILNAVGRISSAPVFGTAVSRKAHGSPGTTFDLALAAAPQNPTTEPRAASAMVSHTIVFGFDKAVISGTVAVTEGTATAGTPTFNGSEMIVPLSGVTDGQYVTVAVSDVTSAEGGTGGSGSARVGFLFGDVDQNRTVTPSDRLAVNAVLANFVSPSNFLKDVNLSGTVSLTDLVLVNNNMNHALPAP